MRNYVSRVDSRSNSKQEDKLVESTLAFADEKGDRD